MAAMHCDSLRFTAMATPCEVRVYAPSAAQAAAAAAAARDEVLRFEAKYSRYREDSVVSRINRSAGSGRPVEVDAETAALLDYAAAAHAQSGGLFDITSGVLRRAWNFRSGRIPQQAEIDALLPLIGWQRLRWQRPRLELPLVGMELDFGGFGKEYAADAAAACCAALGIRHGLVDLGGDIAVIGPQPDGAPWHIGIRDPRAPERAIASIDVAGGGLATSGDYERGMTVNGRRFSHLLDPRCGWPVVSLASVSVLADSCLVAGTATTTALLMGPERGRAWLAGLGLACLSVDADGRIDGKGARNPGRTTGNL